MKTSAVAAALHLLSLCWCSVAELQRVEVCPGEDVTLQCANLSKIATQTEWFRVVPGGGGGASCISSMFESKGEVSLCKGFQQARFRMRSNLSTVFLSISGLEESDLGVYFCGFFNDRNTILSDPIELHAKAVVLTEEIKQGGDGTKLTTITTVLALSMGLIIVLLAVRNKSLKAAAEKQERNRIPVCGCMNSSVLRFHPQTVTKWGTTGERELETQVVYTPTK